MSNDNWFGVEPPKDAEVKVIPLDTEVLYSQSGKVFEVEGFRYSLKAKEWFAYGHYSGADGSGCGETESFLLTPPDSWEKLEEDLDKCIEEGDPCMYYSPSGSCLTCAKPDSETCGCTTAVFKSIKERIHKLAKKDGE